MSKTLLVKSLPDELKFKEEYADWLYPDYLDIDEGKNFPLTAVYSGVNAYRGHDIPQFGEKSVTVTTIGSCVVETDCSCLDGQQCCTFGGPSGGSNPGQAEELTKKQFDPRTASLVFHANTQYPSLSIYIKREGTIIAKYKISAGSLKRSMNDIGVDFYIGTPKTEAEVPDIGTIREFAKNEQIIQVELRLNQQSQPLNGARDRPVWSGITSENIDSIVSRNPKELDDADRLIAHLQNSTRVMLTAICAEPKHQYLREFGKYFRSVSFAAAHLGNFWWYAMARVKSKSLTETGFTLDQIPFPRWMVKKWNVEYDEVGTPQKATPSQGTPFGASTSYPDVHTAAFIYELAIARQEQSVYFNTDSITKAIATLREGQVREKGLYIPQTAFNAPASANSLKSSSNWLADVMAADPQRMDAFDRAIRGYYLKGSQLAFVKLLTTQQQNLALLYGPAGTGKTRTLVATAIGLIKAQFRVLITAPSSGTRDVIAQVLRRSTQLDVNSWLCFRPRAANHDSEMTSAFGIDDLDQLFENASPEHDIRLVVSTNIDSCDPILVTNFKPDILLMDNATQSSSAEALVPLAAFKEDIKFSVLVGDLMQPGPQVNFLSLNEAADALRLSMFEKLWRDPSMGNSRSTSTLCEQYRMHPELFEFPKAFIYGSEQFRSLEVDGDIRLHEKTERGVLEAMSPLKSQNLWKAHRRVGIDCDGPSTEEEESGSSMSNETEARQTIDILRLLVKCGVKTNRIFVITPFRSQVNLIKGLISGESCEDICTVEIDTPVQFQGRQCDVTILTLVQNNPNETGSIGMIGRADILNLAMTRAKQWVFIIGNISGWRKAQKSSKQPMISGSSRQALKRLLNSMSTNQEIISSSDWYDTMGMIAPKSLRSSTKSSRTRKNKKKTTAQPEEVEETAADTGPPASMAGGNVLIDAQSDEDSRPAKRQCMNDDWGYDDRLKPWPEMKTQCMSENGRYDDRFKPWPETKTQCMSENGAYDDRFKPWPEMK